MFIVAFWFSFSLQKGKEDSPGDKEAWGPSKKPPEKEKEPTPPPPQPQPQEQERSHTEEWQNTGLSDVSCEGIDL